MARYFEFLSQFYGFHLTHPRIIEKLLMGNPICELGLCALKVRIRLSAFVASYFLPIAEIFLGIRWQIQLEAFSRIFEKTRKFSTTPDELLSVV
jgi:hypothetical protein